MERIGAPFSPLQVERLNAWQQRGDVHPFTCVSGRRTDSAHLDGEGILVAKEDGWHCPFCEYRQDWAYSMMAEAIRNGLARAK